MSNNHKKLVRRLGNVSQAKCVAVFMGLFGTIGIVMLVVSFAATSPNAVVSEAENYVSASGTSLVADASASGGQAIAFQAVCPDGQTGTPPNCTSTVPAQCLSGGAYLWANLVACGWPGASNTGYPAGTSLQTSASHTVSTNNTVIDGQQINGSITINAQNVTIKNSLINYSGSGGGGSGAIKILAGASAIIDHVEVNGNSAVHTCVWHEGSSVQITNLKCHDIEDGVFSWADTGNASSGNNLTMEDSYLYNFNAVESNGHFDGYQTEGAAHVVLRHNTFQSGIDGTSAIAIWNSQKTSDDFLVENNLIKGGGFSIYAHDYSPTETNPVGGFAVSNVRFLNNRFSNVDSGCVGDFGVWFFRSSWTYQGGPTNNWSAPGNARTGNTIIETGQSVDNGNPTVNGQLCS